jgi:hypothetical protein
MAGRQAKLIDPASTRAESSVRWQTDTGVDPQSLSMYSFPVPGRRLIGGVLPGGRTLLVADLTGAGAYDLAGGKQLWHKKLSEMGLSSLHCMGVGAQPAVRTRVESGPDEQLGRVVPPAADGPPDPRGVFVAGDATGKIVCVEGRTGEIRWQSELVGGNRYPVGPIHVGAGGVLIGQDTGRTVTCFHLVSGKAIGQWSDRNGVQAAFTPQGLLVVLVDGTLSLLDPGQVDEPVWTREYQRGSKPTLLGIDGDRILLAPQAGGASVHVLSVAGRGRAIAAFELAGIDDQPAGAVSARAVGEHVYLLAGPSQLVRGRVDDGQLPRVRGLTCQKYDMVGERIVWNRRLDSDVTTYHNVLPVEVGREHLVVTAKRRGGANGDTRVWVLADSDGGVVETFQPTAEAQGTDDAQRMAVVGPPAMTDGQLVVEELGGVSVYGAAE